MKKVLSIVIVISIIFSAMVSFAENNAKVIITEVKSGDVFPVGYSVTLGADATSYADGEIAHIDFYANESKIPGSITGAEGTMVWYTPAAGRYTLKAVATSAGDKAVKYQSNVIIVTVDSTGNSYEAITASPEIPDGKTEVDVDLDKYRVRFSEAVVGSTAKGAFIVKAGDTTLTEGTDYYVVTGTDYADITFDRGLHCYETYTVSIIPDMIQGYSLDSVFVGEYEWTFTTIYSLLEDPLPVVSMAYPADGAVIAENAEISAKVMFDNLVKKVEIYSGDPSDEVEDTLLGEAEAREDWEYNLSLTLTEPSYTIYAVATLNDDSILKTAPIDVTVAEFVDYHLRGIMDGERIALKEELSRVLTVVNKPTDVNAQSISDQADNVSKVVFKSNGVDVFTDSEAPYEYDFNFNTIGENNVTAVIYDIYGNIRQVSCDYTTLVTKDGVRSSSYKALCSSDYENGSISFPSATKTTNTVVVDPYDETGENHVLKISAEGTGKATHFLGNNDGIVRDAGDDRSRIIVAEFKINRGTSYWQRVEFGFSDSYANSVRLAKSVVTLVQEGKTGSDHFETNTWHTVKLILDQTNKTFISFLDGREIKRGSHEGTTKSNVTLTASFSEWDSKGEGVCYIDDFRIQTYDLDNTEAFGVYQGGGEISNLSGDSAEVDVTVANTSGTTQSFVNIVAVYESDGSLVSSEVFGPITIKDNGISHKIYNPSLVSGEKQGTIVRLFTLDSLANLVPIGTFS